MEAYTEDYFLTREKADQSEGAHTLLGKILTGRCVQQTGEMFVIDAVCSHLLQTINMDASIAPRVSTDGYNA